MRLFESARQAPLFAVFFCVGAVLGAVYDILYVFRKENKKAAINISDIFFCLCFFALFALTAWLFNSGEVRWHFFLALFAGFCVERVSLGFFIKKLIDFTAKIVYNLGEKSDIKSKLGRLKK